MARMLAIEIDRLSVLRGRANPVSQLTVGELVARGLCGTADGHHSGKPVRGHDAVRRSFAAQSAISARRPGRCQGAHHRGDEFCRRRCRRRPRRHRTGLEPGIGQIAELDFSALQYGAVAEVPRPLRGEPALAEPLSQLNPSFLPAQGQRGDVLIRMGQPQQGLEQILQTIRAATPNDPTAGYWYLFAAEAELELRHDQAALDWALRADTFMPGSPLVKAWLASIYATIGDKSDAAKYVAALTKMAPGRTQLFIQRTSKDAGGDDSRPRTRILDGLRLALGASLG